MGPNIAATLAVPRLWAANKAIRMMTVSGTTKSLNAGLASLSPSTADNTEIAGVITESPRNIEAPITPNSWTAARTTSSGPPTERACSQRRQRQSAAFAVVVGAQQDQHVFQRYGDDQRPDNERKHPQHDVTGDDVVSARSHCGFAEGIEGAGPDVAVDDADAAECERNESRRRVLSSARGGRRLIPGTTH